MSNILQFYGFIYLFIQHVFTESTTGLAIFRHAEYIKLTKIDQSSLPWWSDYSRSYEVLFIIRKSNKVRTWFCKII